MAEIARQIATDNRANANASSPISMWGYMIVTDDDVQKALDYLRTNAPKAAIAKANRIYMTEYRKTVKSNGMQEHLNKPVAAQEREAYRTADYIAHLEAMREAIRQDVLNEWGRAAAEATIEAWRTYNANRRGEAKLQ